MDRKKQSVSKDKKLKRKEVKSSPLLLLLLPVVFVGSTTVSKCLLFPVQRTASIWPSCCAFGFDIPTLLYLRKSYTNFARKNAE